MGSLRFLGRSVVELQSRLPLPFRPWGRGCNVKASENWRGKGGKRNTFRIGWGCRPKEVQRVNIDGEPFGRAFGLGLENRGEKPNHRYILRVAEVGEWAVAVGPPSVLRDVTDERK